MNIDAFEFAKLGKELSGETPLACFTRILKDLPKQNISKQEGRWQHPLNKDALNKNELSKDALDKDALNKDLLKQNKAQQKTESSLAEMIDNDDTGKVNWSIKGVIGSGNSVIKGGLNSTLDLPVLCLSVKAKLVLVCQRCLSPYIHAIYSESTLQLVHTIEELNEDEGQQTKEEDDPIWSRPDKVLGSHHFNLLEAIEDELILSLPYIPKHDVCFRSDLVQPKPRDQRRGQDPIVLPDSPFAVLEKLKQLSN